MMKADAPAVQENKHKLLATVDLSIDTNDARVAATAPSVPSLVVDRVRCGMANLGIQELLSDGNIALIIQRILGYNRMLTELGIRNNIRMMINLTGPYGSNRMPMEAISRVMRSFIPLAVRRSIGR